MKKLLPLILFLLSISPLLISDKLLLLKNPPIWPDEAIFFDTSKNLAETGNLSSNIFGGIIPGLEQHSAWYPPLFFYLEAFWISHVGSTIESIRLISVIFSIFALGFFFLILKKTSNFYLATLGTFLLSIDRTFQDASRISRMDMMSFFLITLTIYLFIKALDTKKPRGFLWPGVTSALCLVTHPLGAIAPVTSIIFLFFNKEAFNGKVKKISFIVIPSIIAIALWLFSMKDWLSLFINQYSLQFARKAQMTPGIWGDFISDRYFFSLYSVFLLIFLIFAYQNFRNKILLNRLFILGFLVSLIIIVWGKEGWYELYLQPFVFLITVTNLRQSVGRKIIFYPSLALTLTVIIINLLVLQGSVKTLTKSDYYAFGDELLKNIPQNSIISESLIPDAYFALKNKKITLYEFPTVPVDPKKYKEVLDISNYLLINISTNSYMQDYVQRNTLRAYQITKGGYSALLIELVPKYRRI